jgi:CheY-like chemotaxis protein
VLHYLKSLLSTAVAPGAAVSETHLPWTTDDLPAGLCVLVVDDNPVNLMLAAEMLAYLGVMPLLAADGAEAVALATARRLSLILMDLQMPVLDGLAATQQIRHIERQYGHPRVPVVAHTSLVGHGQPLQAHGIDDVLPKPCELTAMRKCLLHWCSSPDAVARGPLAQPARYSSAQT